MPQINDQIRARVDEFVGELSDLIRAAAFQAVEEALGGSMSGSGARRAPGPVRRKKKAARRAAGRPAGGGASNSSDMLAHIRSNPGQRLEEMSASMGVSSSALRPAVQQLLADGSVHTEGRARGTRYFAGGGGGRGAKKKRGGARRKSAGRKKGGRRRKKAGRRTKSSAAAAAE